MKGRIQKTKIALFFCFVVLLFALPVLAFSDNSQNENENNIYKISDEENDLIIKKTDAYYNRGDYLKAVEEINLGIELYQKVETIPDNIKMMGEAAYYAWINSINKRNEAIPLKLYNKIILSITLHPEVYSIRINALVLEMYEKEKSYLEYQRKECIEKDNRSKLDSTLNSISELEQTKRNLEDVVAGKKSVDDIRKVIKVEAAYQRARTVRCLMIVLYGLIFLSLVILVFVVRRNHKRTIHAQEQFETTMKVVSILNYNPEKTESPFSPLSSTDENSKLKPMTKNRKKIGLTDFESVQMAMQYFDCEESKKNFLTLQNQCIELSEKIDKVTGRKRNGKKVSELVFKLCKISGVDDELALIYYCASMIYDAGFLSVSKNILQGEHLTIKERYEVRSHVQKAGEYFGFIPENVRRIFLDAAEFHHENIDGKGYLAGLSGNKIPLIARFIRVSESYISLISSRSYKKIMDTDSALKELKKTSGIYDTKILALLEQVV